MGEPALVSERLRIGSYETIFELGRGGMGTAYLARALGAGGFERLVVIKRLNRDMLGNLEALERFVAEARVSASVHHANVVGTQQVGEDADGPFLVLDYVEGTTLEELVDRARLRGAPIPPPIVLRVGLDALSGLDAVHNARDASGRPLNILHRDVSLQNVLVGRDGVSRVADFGIAKSELSSFSTDQSYIVGKLLYLPREYLRRQPIGPTLDVYALGITLWLAVTAVELWEGASEAQLVRHIIEDPVPRPSAFVKIAPQIESVILRACAPEALDRYQSAREMVDAIDLVGRLTGWVASHADVLRYVEYLAGRDLDARRQRIATTIGQPLSLLTAQGPPPSAPAGENATTRVHPLHARQRSKVPLLVALAAVAVAAGAAGALLLRRPPEPEAVVDTTANPEPAGVAEPASIPNVEPAPATAAPASSAPAAEPAALPPEAPVAAPVYRARRAPAASKPPVAPAPVEVPVAPATPVGPAPAVRAPDEISKTNPYH
jgi:serine/threonine-protein kinase